MALFRGLFAKVTQVFTGRRGIDEDLYEELEEALIQADVSMPVTLKLVADLREAARKNRMSTADQVKDRLKDEIERLLSGRAGQLNWAAQSPTLIMVVGVNGTGKTTSIAKLTEYLQRQRKKVVLAAADTFRAAAIDQLEVWANRLNVDIVRGKEGADPAAVVFDAVQAGRSRGADVVIADTAGRLHTKVDLMDELRKVNRVAERALGRPTDEVLLVLDATIGQNAISQAKAFAEAVPVSGIVLTKMDGTARGGVVISVNAELNIPIKFVGTGEKSSDFAPFRPDEFSASLFAEA